MALQEQCRSVLFACALSGIVAFGQVPGSTREEGKGRINGSVVDADGIPVANAAVSVNVRPSANGSFQPFNTVVWTAADGSFSVGGLPSGKFAVCPAPPSPSLLPPCTWGSEPTATLTKPQTAFMLPIRLQRGSEFHVRIVDPGNALSTKTKDAAWLRLGVRSPNGMVVPVPITRSDKEGSDARLTVPANTHLTFVAASSGLTIAAAAGAPTAPKTGLTTAFTVSAGQAHTETIVLR